MDTNTYNCINIDTYTDIYPIPVAGRVLVLTHLAAKDSFEDAHLVVVISVTLCVIILANTGTCTTCGEPPPPRLAASHSKAATPPAACGTIISHIYLSRGTCTINMSRWRDNGCTHIHVDSGARGCRARGGAVQCICSAVHEAFSR